MKWFREFCPKERVVEAEPASAVVFLVFLYRKKYVDEEEGMMKRFCGFCTRAKLVGAEIASTIVFWVVLYAAARHEIAHLLGR
jgi:hypothetical protein